jgi:hypothetical protein
MEIETNAIEPNVIESLFESAETYAKTTIEITKLKALETTTVIVTSLMSKLIVLILFLLFFLVLNTGIAFLIGDLVGKVCYGFFIVAAFYLVAGIIAHFFLFKWLSRPIGDFIISQLSVGLK